MTRFDDFKTAARPHFGTVSGSAALARVAVTGKRKFSAVAALAEQYGGTVQPDKGTYPQLVLITFADSV
jgi:hypothetical protein